MDCAFSKNNLTSALQDTSLNYFTESTNPEVSLTILKTFKDSFYSSEKHFLFDNCGFWVCEIKVFLWNLAIVSDGN